MLKRSFTVLLLACTLLILLPLAARADVLITPRNDFFDRHFGDCTFLGRNFVANGSGGSVSVKLEPGSNKEVTALQNGDTVTIQFTYEQGGQTWGATVLAYGATPDGWIPMDQLLLVYDYISFADEHQSEFTAYTGDLSELLNASSVVFWSWPGSGETTWVYGAGAPETVTSWLTPTQVYTDSEGREWGFIPYFYGARNSWVCLSDPANENIPAFNPAPSPAPWPSGGSSVAHDGISTQLLFIIIAVAAVVVVTAVLIRVFWKPKKNEP